MAGANLIYRQMLSLSALELNTASFANFTVYFAARGNPIQGLVCTGTSHVARDAPRRAGRLKPVSLGRRIAYYQYFVIA